MKSAADLMVYFNRKDRFHCELSYDFDTNKKSDHRWNILYDNSIIGKIEETETSNVMLFLGYYKIDILEDLDVILYCLGLITYEERQDGVQGYNVPFNEPCIKIKNPTKPR